MARPVGAAHYDQEAGTDERQGTGYRNYRRASGVGTIRRKKWSIRSKSSGSTASDLSKASFAIEEAFDISVPFNANEPSESDFDISSVAAIIAAVGDLVKEKA